MRLWSIHPKYLDTKGLIALWREGLLAKKVLENKTKGYKNHPQLLRFKKEKDPAQSINQYLKEVYEESLSRKYNFSKDKISKDKYIVKMPVTQGQINYELNHLKNKLKERDKLKFKEIEGITSIELNPVFYLTPGNIEDWEKIN